MKKLFADHQGHTDAPNQLTQIVEYRKPDGKSMSGPYPHWPKKTQKDCPCKSLAAETRTANETRTADSILELIDVSSR